MTIGFIGQGYVGKAYADNFERRGFDIVRYSLEPAYADNGAKILDCSIAFICVPTPTARGRFDCSAVKESLGLLRAGAVAVIKSTLLPGMTVKLQEEFPDLDIMHAPEFLSVATAAADVAHPWGNIIGTAADPRCSDFIHGLLPSAPFQLTCTGTQAELIKYAHNISDTMQILTMNALYDVAVSQGADWAQIATAIEADPHIPTRYSKPVVDGKRGAGGACFEKDLGAFATLSGEPFLREAGYYNRSLLALDKGSDL